MKKALLIVDVQYDFMPGGSLAVDEGDKIVPIINKFLPKFDLVVFTKDWHTSDNIYFADSHKGKKPFEQIKINGKMETLWPVHCVQYTRGADLHDDINFELIKGDFYIFKKGYETNWHPYSGFGDKIMNTGLETFLNSRKVTDVVIMGLATDYCVRDTAVDAAKLGFNTSIILDGTKPINKDLSDTFFKFKENNIKILNSNE